VWGGGARIGVCVCMCVCVRPHLLHDVVAINQLLRLHAHLINGGNLLLDACDVVFGRVQQPEPLLHVGKLLLHIRGQLRIHAGLFLDSALADNVNLEVQVVRVAQEVGEAGDSQLGRAAGCHRAGDGGVTRVCVAVTLRTAADVLRVRAIMDAAQVERAWSTLGWRVLQLALSPDAPLLSLLLTCAVLLATVYVCHQRLSPVRSDTQPSTLVIPSTSTYPSRSYTQPVKIPAALFLSDFLRGKIELLRPTGLGLVRIDQCVDFRIGVLDACDMALAILPKMLWHSLESDRSHAERLFARDGNRASPSCVVLCEEPVCGSRGVFSRRSLGRTSCSARPCSQPTHRCC